MGILDYWCLVSPPRESQIEVLHFIETALKTHKYIFCEMPVGSGKSPVGITTSAYLNGKKGKGNSFIFTPQKILQRQYEDSFTPQELFSLYGKSNYTCDHKHTNCEFGSKFKPRCPTCPSRDAYTKFMTSPNSVLNYQLGLIISSKIEVMKIKKRDLLVLDEGHKLETFLTDFNSISITEYTCKKFGCKYTYSNNPNKVIIWMKDAYIPSFCSWVKDNMSILFQINDKLLEGTPLTKAEITFANEFIRFSEDLPNIQTYFMDTTENILLKSVIVKEQNGFRFKQLFGKDNFKELILPLADKFLFMSATFPDIQSTYTDLGILPEEATFISVDSEFDKEKRPIIVLPSGKMTYGWDGESDDKVALRTNMISTITLICNEYHKEDNGVIHTSSYAISKWLVKELEGLIPHTIIHHNPNNEDYISRDEAIANFTKKSVGIGYAPKLLISPSVTEGLDLIDDIARFNIIAKVPYLSLGDAWVKKRMTHSNEWYKKQALISIIQASGRVVRHSDDWGNTYILDSSFSVLYNSMKRYIPKWWNSAII